MESESPLTGVPEEFDLSTILNGGYLIRNNGDRVEVDSLKGKKLGLYFSASWCGPCRRFTPTLVEVYNELTQGQGENFEIVFVSADRDEQSFDAYFSKMPWLAIPHSNSEVREELDKSFHVNGIPHLVFLDENGKLVSEDGFGIVSEYAAEGFPFTPEHIAKLEQLAEEAKKNQSLKYLLVSKSRDYVLAADGKKLPVSELEGKTVFLYFSMATYGACDAFNPHLIDLYKGLKEEGHNIEIVTIPLDETESPSEKLPWLSLPAKDKCCSKLAKYFELETLPTVVAIGSDGKTLHSNVAEAIEEHGIKAYPFTPEKFLELEKLDRLKAEAQTLESILVSNDLDFIIGKDGIKVPVSDLVGKTVLLYFSAHWCPPCRAFLPSLIKAYHEINKNSNVVEVVFISSDKDQESFNDFFSSMPWLALPFGDKRKQSLSRLFKVSGIPTVVALAPTGRTITTSARELIMSHGARAYPFTPERHEEIEAEHDKIAEAWPKMIKVELHDHELVLTKRRSFICDGCKDQGNLWSFYCKECDFDLHPTCALDEKNNNNKVEESLADGNEAGDKIICDGDVCYKK